MRAKDEPDFPRAISPSALAALRNSPQPPTILDVREPWEVALCAIGGSRFIPMPQIPARLAELPRRGMLVILCHHGMRSLQVADWLRTHGYGNAVNLTGGIDLWAQEVEAGMARY
jgi:rhodanese-related sulfurtransferase